ncbi:MAG: DUF302 domain-containing protein [Acidimicrobiales bacterium]
MDAISVVVGAPIGETEVRVREALRTVGFGVLTEIDLAATLHEKLGEDRPPLKILGACNPVFASKALHADPSMALLLPCNVVLAEYDGSTTVSAADPRALMPGHPELTSEVASLLEKALAAV